MDFTTNDIIWLEAIGIEWYTESEDSNVAVPELLAMLKKHLP